MKYFPYILYSLVFLLLLYFLSVLFIQEENDDLNYLSSFEGRDLIELQEEIESSDSISLTFMGVHLEQGENGVSLWELDGLWATYAQDSTNLFIKEPNILYHSEDSTPINVIAIDGNVLENNTLITLQNNVVVNQDTLSLQGNYLEFLVEEDLFLMPNGGTLHSPTNIGKANTLRWDATSNIIYAEGEVVLIINDDNTSFTLEHHVKKPPQIEG